MVSAKNAKAKKKRATAEDKGPDDYWQKKLDLDKKGIKLFTQTVYSNWCKSCGICIALCPKHVYDKNDLGGPIVARADDCIGCRICEVHCPDFAISITERYPDRRVGRRDG
ncbi:MAG: 4Fe-4S dicluster domain-containing protein [Thermodesulfobacteriota bacterium]